MAMDHKQLRNKIKTFWESSPRSHKLAPAIPLVPQNDPTTLFTGSGMQQFVPNLLGEPHPLGKRLYNIQRSFRSQDIEEIGDNRHTTMFEMIGNWSLGDYFKEEQIPWFFEFLTDQLKLDQKRLYVTIFEGGSGVARDEESAAIWKKLGFKDDHIHAYSDKKNWWSRAGAIDNMPVGEIGGPDTEVFYDFGEKLRLHEKSPWKNERCHPNCDCGRFLEIGNNVFIQYKKEADGTLSELPAKNVDFGGGLERQLAAVYHDPDVFKTDIYTDIISTIEEFSGKKYSDDENKPSMRVIADHIKAATLLIKDGVLPSNKEQGYVLRRLIRRAQLKMYHLGGGLTSLPSFESISDAVLRTYDGVYFDRAEDRTSIPKTISDEISKFGDSMDRGLKEVNKIDTIDGKKAFDLYQSYGFPLEITEELFRQKGQDIDKQQFYSEFERHKTLSRSSSVGKFKGGLADHSDQVLKYHTATHLLHQALFDLYGDDIRQEGSNITGARLRFDFFTTQKIASEDKPKIAALINEKIKEALPMRFKIMPKDEAVKTGARSFFREKYPDNVKVYYIGGRDDHPETAYSKEFCGGPHVTNTSEIGTIDVYKLEKIGSNLYRIYAK